jgi:hypothetical protein
MNIQMGTLNSSRAEVSGWDTKEDFFVEKTQFNSEDEDRMEIALTSSLREGCVVFVRVLEPFATSNTFPIAYHAVAIRSRDMNGRALIGLERLRPRAFDGYTDLPLHPISSRLA